MDSEAHKLKPVDQVLANSVNHLARSIHAVAAQIVADLNGGDVAASLLWCHGELDRLSTEAAEIAGDELRAEGGKVGVG